MDEEDNENIITLPDEKEVRTAVFSLNGSSACRPDGFTGAFYQDSWDIIGNDFTRLVKAFFCGQELTTFITHTNLILLPKKKIVKGFADLGLLVRVVLPTRLYLR